VTFTLVTFVISLLAGAFGAILGLGGGMIIIPALTLLMGVDIRVAIAASMVSIIATSSGAAAAYLRDRLTNVKVAMFLELGSTTGALTGAFLSALVPRNGLFVAFGVILAFSAIAMLRRMGERDKRIPPDPLADRLGLHGGQAPDMPAYRVSRSLLGLFLMYWAGVIAGLLGVGAGVLKVPAMDIVMGMPLKASTATSNFMIGVTAAAGALVYLLRGDVDELTTAPVALGVLLGAVVGAKALAALPVRGLRIAFVVVLIVVAVRMVLQGVCG